MSEIKPVIDDQFWFERSGEMVKDAGGRLDKWADRMRDMIVWGYGIYTASSILAVEYKKISEWWILLTLSVPYFLIIFVYWKSQQSQVPIDVAFHPDSPDQIKKAFIKAYEEKSKKVTQLVRWSLLAIFSLAVALITSLVVKNGQRVFSGTREENYFHGVVQKNNNDVYLVLSGQFPGDSLLRIQTSTLYFDSVAKRSLSTDSVFNILNAKNGVFQYEHRVDTQVFKIHWSISWSQNSYRKTLQKEFILRRAP